MKIYISIVLAVIFLLLAIIHFNWAFGGRWGFEQAIPTNEQGEQILNPRNIESAIIGLGLLFMAIFYILIGDFLNFELPKWILKSASWIIPIVFILRAIGDFRYIGFFKKIKQTEFGQLDTIFYSPLCLLIGILGISIIFYHKNS